MPSSPRRKRVAYVLGAIDKFFYTDANFLTLLKGFCVAWKGDVSRTETEEDKAKKLREGFAMRKFKLVHLIVIFTLFLALQGGSSGKGCSGCGGGGNGDVASFPPSPEPSPLPPIFDFDVLSGQWTARNGTGTAQGPGGKFDLSLVSGQADIEIASITNKGVIVKEFVDFAWGAYQGNRYVDTLSLYDYIPDYVSVARTGRNTFSYVFPSARTTIEITVLTEKTVYVTEKGTYTFYYSGGYEEQYDYDVSYYMDKKSPSLPPPPVNFEALSGTWNAENGVGVAYGPDGKFDLELVYGEAQINVLDVTENTATITEYVDFQWKAFQNGAYIRNIPLYDNATEYATVRRVADNIFEYSFPSGSKITITLLSSAQAFVEEKGTYGLGSYTYTYSGSYHMSKQ